MVQGNFGPRDLTGKKAKRALGRQDRANRQSGRQSKAAGINNGQGNLFARMEVAKKRAAQIRQVVTDDPYEQFIQQVQYESNYDDLIGKAYSESSYQAKKEKRQDAARASEIDNESRLRRLITKGSELNTIHGVPEKSDKTPEERLAAYEKFAEQQAVKNAALKAAGLSDKDIENNDNLYNVKKFMQGDFGDFPVGAAAAAAGFDAQSLKDAGIFVPDEKKKAKSEDDGKPQGQDSFDSVTGWFKDRWKDVKDSDIVETADKFIGVPDAIKDPVKDAALTVLDVLGRPYQGVQNTFLENAKLNTDDATGGKGLDPKRLAIPVLGQLEMLGALQGGVSPLESLDEAADNPGDYLKNMGKAFKEGFWDDKETGGQDVIIENAAKSDPSGEGLMHNPWYQFGAGLTTDVMLDPLSYVGAGLARSAVEGVKSLGSAAQRGSRVSETGPKWVRKRDIDGNVVMEDADLDGAPLKDTQWVRRTDPNGNIIMEDASLIGDELESLGATRKAYEGTPVQKFFDKKNLPIDDTPVGAAEYMAMLGYGKATKNAREIGTHLQDTSEYTGAIQGKLREGKNYESSKLGSSELNERLDGISRSVEDLKQKVVRDAGDEVISDVVGTSRYSDVISKGLANPGDFKLFGAYALGKADEVGMAKVVDDFFGDSLQRAGIEDPAGAVEEVRKLLDTDAKDTSGRSENYFDFLQENTPEVQRLSDQNLSTHRNSATQGWRSLKKNYVAAKSAMVESKTKLDRAIADGKSEKQIAKLSKAYNYHSEQLSRVFGHAVASRFQAELGGAGKLANDNMKNVFYAANQNEVDAYKALIDRADAELNEPAVSLTGKGEVDDTPLYDQDLGTLGFDPKNFSPSQLEDIWDQASGLDSHQFANHILRMANNELKSLESPVGIPDRFSFKTVSDSLKSEKKLDPKLKSVFNNTSNGVRPNFNAAEKLLGRELTDKERYDLNALAYTIESRKGDDISRQTGNATRRPREARAQNVVLSRLDAILEGNLPTDVVPTSLVADARKFNEFIERRDEGGYEIVYSFQNPNPLPGTTPEPVRISKAMSGEQVENLLKRELISFNDKFAAASFIRTKIKQYRGFQNGTTPSMTTAEARELYSYIKDGSYSQMPSEAQFVKEMTNKGSENTWAYKQFGIREPEYGRYSAGWLKVRELFATENGVTAGRLEETRRKIMGTDKLKHYDKPSSVAHQEIANSLGNAAEAAAKSVDRGDAFTRALDEVFEKPDSINTSYPKQLVLPKVVESTSDDAVKVVDEKVEVKEPKTSEGRAAKRESILKASQKSQSRDLKEVISDLEKHVSTPEDRQTLGALKRQYAELESQHADELREFNKLQNKISHIESVTRKLVDEDSLLRVLQTTVKNPNVRGPLSNWSLEGYLDVPGVSSIIRGFERLNSPEFLQKFANKSGAFRNPFMDPNGGPAKFTNPYTRLFGAPQQSMNSEFQLASARFSGQTPRIIAHHVERLNAGLRKMPKDKRRTAWTDARFGYDNENARIIMDEMDRLAPYFTGELYPDMTVNDIFRFVPQEYRLSGKIQDDIAKDGISGRGLMEHFSKQVKEKGDPLEFIWRMNVAVEQAVGYASLRNDILKHGVKTVNVVNDANGKAHFTEAQKRAIRAGNKNAQYKSYKSPEFSAAINGLRNKGWKEIDSNGFEGTLFPPELVPEINKLLSITDPRHYKDFERVMDSATRGWKMLVTIFNPSYYTTNLFGEVMSGFLGGVNNPQRYSDAIKVMKYASRNKDYDAFVAKNGWEKHLGNAPTGGRTIIKRSDRDVTEADLATLYKDTGLDTGFVNTEVGANLHAKTPTDRLRGLRKFGEAAEDFPRMAHFIDAINKAPKHLKIDEAAAYAAEQVRKYHFDYNDLSKFEKTVMGRVFPFYTFTRKLLPLYAQSVIQKPGKVLAMPKLYANYSNAFGPLEGTAEMAGLIPNYDELEEAGESEDWNRAGLMFPVGPDSWLKGQDPVMLATGRLSQPGYTAGMMLNPFLKMANAVPGGVGDTIQAGAETTPQYGISQAAGMGKDKFGNPNEFDSTEFFRSVLGTGYFKDNGDTTKNTKYTKERTKAELDELLRGLYNGR